MASSSSSPSRPPATATVVALGLLLVAGAALRLYHLDHESVWLDEAFSVATARTSLANIVAETGQDVHPPLHYFLLFFWAKGAGGSAWAARLLSVFFSLGAMVAAYVVAAELRGRLVGLITVALLAISVFQVEFAQEARMYALLSLLGTLSTYTFIRMTASSSGRWFAAYTAISALMIYTHAYAAFVLAGQAASVGIIVVRRHPHAVTIATRWVVALIGIFAAFLPWLAIFTWQFSSVQRGFWIPEPPLKDVFAPLRAYAGSGAVLAVLAPFTVIGIVSAGRPGLRAHRGDPVSSVSARAVNPLVILLPWMLGPILLPFALSLVSSPIFLAKYTIAASIPFAILAADGLAALPWSILRLSVLSCVVVLSATPLRTYYGTIRKDNWRAAVPIIERQVQPDDVLVFYPYFHQIPFDFYRQRDDLMERAFPLFTPPPPADGWDRAFERAVGAHRRVWLVTMQGDPTKAAVLEQFRARMTEGGRQQLQHMDVYLFERR